MTEKPPGSPEIWRPTQKSRRCYHRVISGLERGGQLRFITLTSGPDSPADIQRSFRALYGRLKRRGLIKGYIKVPETTKSGRLHLHIIFRGSFIAQETLSVMWADIHRAYIVDIRKIKQLDTKRDVANYMAKYMSKEAAGRYSWSWGWVWRGFARDWQNCKRLIGKFHAEGVTITFGGILWLWRQCLREGSPALIATYTPG